jgi:hypothetical protein
MSHARIASQKIDQIPNPQIAYSLYGFPPGRGRVVTRVTVKTNPNAIAAEIVPTTISIPSATVYATTCRDGKIIWVATVIARVMKHTNEIEAKKRTEMLPPMTALVESLIYVSYALVWC